MTDKVLVTGASGFIGRRFVASLKHAGVDVRAVFRSGETPLTVQGFGSGERVLVNDLTASTDWGHALSGVDIVVHLAARVHVMQESSADPLAEFRLVNVEGTLALARQAAAAGVRRFVFMSSIKVNGEVTSPGRPFTAADTPAPADPYGVSKYEAEQGLFALARSTGMEVVVIRPVLVYGPGVGANFMSMMRWLNREVPLPLGAIKNSRSMVALENLVDLTRVCLWHPAAANEVFLASDGEDLSTPELLRRTASAFGKRARLFYVPAGLLGTSARLMGKGAFAQRLCGSLQADITKTQQLLDWKPPLSVNEGLSLAAAYFRENAD